MQITKQSICESQAILKACVLSAGNNTKQGMITSEELCTDKERLFTDGVWDQKTFPSSSEVSFMLLEGMNVRELSCASRSACCFYHKIM